MLEFLQANWGTIAAAIVILLLVFLAIKTLRRDKKEGIGPCGQKCANCSHSSECHRN